MIIERSFFEIGAPWWIGEGTRFNITLNDRRLVGSENYFIVLDLYSFFSPSHPERHFAAWEIPLKALKSDHNTLVLQGWRIVIEGEGWFKRFQPKWKGSRELLGYCTLTASLWDRTGGSPRQLEAKSSDHVALKNHQDLPLEAMLVSVTQRCNLRCRFCTREHGAGLETADVGADVLEGVLEAAPYLMFIGLQGIGEPLLNPDLARITQDIKKKMPHLGRLALTTNGTLMSRDMAARLVDSGLNTITFSVDGCTKAVYESKRVGANFEDVITRIGRAVEYGKSTGRKDLWFVANFIIMNDNVHEVPGFVRLAARLGLDTLGFYLGREYPSERISPIENSVLINAQAEATALAREYGINVKFANPLRSRDRICFFMQGVYLWLSGEVLPCHRMEPPGDPWPVRVFGNLKHEPLIDIWNKPAYREFRKTVVRGRLQEECKGCTHCSSVRY